LKKKKWKKLDLMTEDDIGNNREKLKIGFTFLLIKNYINVWFESFGKKFSGGQLL
jgi:hypothetical protein